MASFQYHLDSEIARASLISKLNLESNWNDKSGCETWSCAFSPNESYFAWSRGNRIVVCVPWNAFKNCPVSKDSKDENGCEIERPEVCIDCGYLVWAVSFSCLRCSNKCSVKHPIPPWTRFHCSGDVILATGLANSRIRIWDVVTGTLLMELMDHKDIIRDLTFAPDHSLRLVSASRDMTLKVWELRDDGNMVKTLKGHPRWVFTCKWSPDARYLASAGSGKQVLVWNMDTYNIHRKLDGHLHDVVSCDFSTDGALLATASWDTTVIIWDPVSGEILKRLGHLHPPPRPIFASGINGNWVRSVAFSADSCHIASVADDGYVRFWNILKDDSDPVEVAVMDNALCCSYSPSGQALAVGTRNGSVTFFASPKEIPSLQHLSRAIVRKGVTCEEIKMWTLPRILSRYLLYKDFN